MAIKFPCPICGEDLSFKDDSAGKRGKCLKCGQPIRVPDANAKMPDLPEDEPWYYGYLASYARILIVLSLIAIVLAIIAFVYTFVESKGDLPAWHGRLLATLIGLALLNIVPAALVLLFVDIGRSLREMKYKR